MLALLNLAYEMFFYGFYNSAHMHHTLIGNVQHVSTFNRKIVTIFLHAKAQDRIFKQTHQ